jgi:hypothetical protein
MLDQRSSDHEVTVRMIVEVLQVLLKDPQSSTSAMTAALLCSEDVVAMQESPQG